MLFWIVGFYLALKSIEKAGILVVSSCKWRVKRCLPNCESEGVYLRKAEAGSQLSPASLSC